MQIDIHAGGGIDLKGKGRAYVEYRMFSAASRFERNGMRVSVWLDETGSPARARYRCMAAVDLGAERRVRVSASADRLHAAVDRAAERLSASVERRMVSASGNPMESGETREPVPTRPDRSPGKEDEP
jgi:ribosome-associated translation inhibitor RaiA